jgi:medium-chain acyl-[acyl-carrier-protein] hydrolase
MLQGPVGSDGRAIRLFCVPHAGGGPSAFRGWRALLGSEVETSLIHLPGREGRFREKPYVSMEPLVSDLTDAVLSDLFEGQRFAFFGNSLGGLIAFEAVHEIQRRVGYEATHLFVSATGAPHIPSPLPPISHLGDRELVREVSHRYGAIPAPILEDEEFLAAMLPVLRADIHMLEAYAIQALRPVSCPITAFGGTRDQTVAAQDIDAWREQTTSSFTRIFLDEDHLYLQSARDQLTATIRETLVASACPS